MRSNLLQVACFVSIDRPQTPRRKEAIQLVLIFGGVYQGKLDYAIERFGSKENDIFRCSNEDTVMPCGKSVIYELDKWVLSLVRADIDTDSAIRHFIENNCSAVVICNDISCGIVPEDPVMRKWREATGRAVAELVRSSNEIIRLFCGIPTRIK